MNTTEMVEPTDGLLETIEHILIDAILFRSAATEIDGELFAALLALCNLLAEHQENRRWRETKELFGYPH